MVNMDVNSSVVSAMAKMTIRISGDGSQFVVLACGGIGGLFQNSTNYPHIAGDGLGIAMKHQVKLEHLDYIQIHPTTLFSHKPGRRFLISESVRGEGALLYDKNGQRFTNELQPRDLLSQAIFEQMEKDGTDFVWEDMRPLGEKTIHGAFPEYLSRNVWRKDLIRVKSRFRLSLHSTISWAVFPSIWQAALPCTDYMPAGKPVVTVFTARTVWQATPFWSHWYLPEEQPMTLSLEKHRHLVTP